MYTSKQLLRTFIRESITSNNLLTEGGLVGHLQHLYDDKDLTFGEIKNILSLASQGKLENATEKVDGMNLVFSYDISNSELRVARNKTEINSGGLNAVSLAAKFKDRGSVEKAFNTGFSVLDKAVGSLSTDDKFTVFGENANRWYSVEIIYVEDDHINVIMYDSNNIVFHGWPIFERKVVADSTGKNKVQVSTIQFNQGFEILSGRIETMQEAVASTNWNVRKPSIVRLNDISSGNVLKRAVDRISDAMSSVGVSDSDTIGTYLSIPVRNWLDSYGLEKGTYDKIMSRVMEDEDAPKLQDIKKLVDKRVYDEIKDFIDKSPSVFKKMIRPIELAINDFAVEVLKGLESALISDPGSEIDRIKGILQKTISDIQSSGDESRMSILATQLNKLGSSDNITSTMEGIVFMYRGNAYKFTGSFAAANQILGLLRYSR